MKAQVYYERFQRDGRAYLGVRWLCRVSRRLVLCRDSRKFPVVRMVRDDESVSGMFRAQRESVEEIMLNTDEEDRDEPRIVQGTHARGAARVVGAGREGRAGEGHCAPMDGAGGEGRGAQGHGSSTQEEGGRP